MFQGFYFIACVTDYREVQIRNILVKLNEQYTSSLQNMLHDVHVLQWLLNQIYTHEALNYFY